MSSDKSGYKLLDLSDSSFRNETSSSNNKREYYNKRSTFLPKLQTKYLLYAIVFLITFITFYNYKNSIIHSSHESQNYQPHAAFLHSSPNQEAILKLGEQIPVEKTFSGIEHDDLSFPPESIEQDVMDTVWWSYEYRNSSNYIAITNYIRANQAFNYNTTVTLSTQSTVEYLYHSLELCKRWDGPISIAVFCPGTELKLALTLIKYLRQCLPKPLSECIKNKITWHIVYNVNHGPRISELTYPRHYLAATQESLFVNENICPKFKDQDTEKSIQQFHMQLAQKIFENNVHYRKANNLVYPINVLRNTARLAARSKYLLLSDIELYPSVNLVSQFVNLITRHNITQEFSYINKYVFTLPIFETDSDVSSPKTMQELAQLFIKSKAVFFHKWVCDLCQRFPHRHEWINLNFNNLPTDDRHLTAHYDETKIFEITQRNSSLNSWEPIYIGTNDEPLYDERLSWDGMRDKMSQAYHLCLEDYYLIVIENAFLVHAPGIKHIDKNERISKYSHMIQNNKFHDSIIADLKSRYATSPKLQTC